MPPTVAALTWGIALKGLLIQAAFCAVWDAFFFFALAMLPVARSANTATQIGQGFGGALWGLNVGASIFIMQGLGRMLTALPAMHPAAWALLAASGPMVLVSLLLSENLVRRRTELPSQPLPPPQAATRGWKLRLGESLGGLRQFIVRETVIQSVMVWGFAVMGWIGFTALLRYQGARDSQPPAAMLGGFFALVPAVRSMLPSMRHLRSLPISGSSLASVLVLMPAGIVLVNTLLVNVVFSGFAAVSWAIGLAQGFGLASVAALGVALSMRIPAPFMIVALGMVSGPLMWLSHGLRRSGGPDGSLLAIVIVSAAGVMALTFLLARHWLRTSPVLYRPQRLFGLPIGAAASR